MTSPTGLMKKVKQTLQAHAFWNRPLFHVPTFSQMGCGHIVTVLGPQGPSPHVFTGTTLSTTADCGLTVPGQLLHNNQL